MADWAYQRLLEAILDSELRAGERLNVPALAEQLGVSRSPVREAVQRLIRERLAREEPHRGAVVAEIRQEPLQALYQVREVLEGLAARLAAERLSDAELAGLRAKFEHHKRVVDEGGVGAHIEADQDFHAAIAAAAGNDWLEELLAQFRILIRLAMTTTVVTGGPKSALRDHRRILEALEGRDPVAAETAARRHIARLRDVLQADA